MALLSEFFYQRCCDPRAPDAHPSRSGDRFKEVIPATSAGGKRAETNDLTKLKACDEQAEVF